MCVSTAIPLELPLRPHPSSKVRVNFASLIDRPPLSNEPFELVEVLLAALVEVPQLEVLLDEVRVGALGDFVLGVCVRISVRPVKVTGNG